MKRTAGQELHAVGRRQRKKRTVISKPHMDIAQSLHGPVLLNPPDGLRMIQVGIIVHIPSGGTKAPCRDTQRHDKLPRRTLVSPRPRQQPGDLPPSRHGDHKARGRKHKVRGCANPAKQTKNLRVYCNCHHSGRHDTADICHAVSHCPADESAQGNSGQKSRDCNIEPIEKD